MVDEMSSSHPPSVHGGVHPVAIDYSTAAAPDAAAAAARAWSLVDFKPCMTTCGLSTYTGKRPQLRRTAEGWERAQCRGCQEKCFLLLFTARRYASVVLAVVVCPSIRLSVCHTPVLYQNG